MDMLLLLALLIALPFLYQYVQDRRENELAKRLEKLHDPNAASAAVDGLIARSKVEEAVAKDFGDRGPF